MRREKTILAAAAIALVVGLLASPVQAITLSARAIFFEINDTDGDAGDPDLPRWRGLGRHAGQEPARREVILNVLGEGGVGQQGITELFLESAEPSFEDQPLEELLALFPRGLLPLPRRDNRGQYPCGAAPG